MSEVLGIDKKIVIFDIAAQTESVGALIFDARHAHAALEGDGRTGVTEASGGNGDDALETFAKLERLPRDAVEAIASQVFCRAFNGLRVQAAKQPDWPMQRYPLALTTLLSYDHGGQILRLDNYSYSFATKLFSMGGTQTASCTELLAAVYTVYYSDYKNRNRPVG